MFPGLPRTNYTARLESYDRARQKLDRRAGVLSFLRLVFFILFSYSLYIIRLYDLGDESYFASAGLLLVFFLTVWVHGRLESRSVQLKLWEILCRRGREKQDFVPVAERKYQIYEYHLTDEDRKTYQSIPGVEDLDLIGPFSLYNSVDNTVLQGGRQKLLDRLCAPLRLEYWREKKGEPAEIIAAEKKEIEERQAAVGELASLRSFLLRWQATGLHWSLARNPELTQEKISAAFLEDDFQDQKPGWLLRLHWLLKANVLATHILWFGHLLELLPDGWWRLSLSAQIVFLIFILFRKTTSREWIHQAGLLLPVFSRMIGLLEKRHFHSIRLRRIHGDLASAAQPVRSLVRVNRALGVRESGLLWFILNFWLLWDVHFQQRLWVWTRKHGPKMSGWLNTLYEFDELASLAITTAEMPRPKNWPEIGGEVRPATRVERLIHPLLDPARAVPNDFSLEETGQIVILTGSNMSGKSTFLRTLGMAHIMTNLGLPVLAQSARINPGILLCSMKIADSLEDGISLFYREVLKIRYILEGVQLLLPSFLLIDEMLRGTNSRERRIAAATMIREFTRANTQGVLATHDAELSRLDMEGKILNYHFTETLSEGQMVFDYHLHEGPLRQTNALRVLRQAGIDLPFPVEEENYGAERDPLPKD